MRFSTPLLAAVLVAPCAAQLTVGVQATNDAGIGIDRANNTRSFKNHPVNTPFTTYANENVYDQSPYAYLQSYVYPPYTYPNGPIYNRVMLMSSVYAAKKSGHKSLHTTGNTKGDPGTNKFRISLTATQATKVKIDWYAYGYIYDASAASIKFTVGSVSKTYNYTTGYSTDTSSVEIPVSGTTNVDVEITGLCQPGTGGSGNAYYDGYYAYLNMNFAEVGTGSFTLYGTGCGKSTIGATGTPTKGSPFTVTLSGAAASSSCALLWGYSKDYYQFIKLPLDLSYMGAKGCFLNVGFNYPWYLSTDAQGAAQGTVYLPWYTSGTIYAQWLLWDPKNPTGGLELTQGAEIKY